MAKKHVKYCTLWDVQSGYVLKLYMLNSDYSKGLSYCAKQLTAQ